MRVWKCRKNWIKGSKGRQEKSNGKYQERTESKRRKNFKKWTTEVKKYYKVILRKGNNNEQTRESKKR